MKKILLVVLLSILTLTGASLSNYGTVSASTLPGGKNYIAESDIDYSNGWLETFYITVKPNTTYTFSVSENLYADDWETEIGSQMDGGLFNTSNGYFTYTFTTGATDTFFWIHFNVDTNYMNFIQTWDVYGGYSGLEFQLEEGSTRTTWEAYQIADIDPPMLNGTIAVSIVNVDSPTTVAAFKETLTATDDNDGDLTSNITVSRDTYTGNENTLGDYEVDFTVSDSSGNTTTSTVIFRVVDVVNPVITLEGSSTINLEYGTSWNDPGYTVTDNYDDSLVQHEAVGTVDDTTLGTYTITYNAEDISGNQATSIVRTINVVDTTAPIQTLNGDSNVYVEFGSNYTELGANWTDAYDGSGTSVITGSVNVGVLGTYTITYNITDSNGNVATELTRTVTVQDTSAPTFTGETTYSYNTGAPKTLSRIMSDITASDLFDGDLTGSIIIQSDNYTGNENIAGSYTVVLSVSDSNSNNQTMTLNITIVDNVAPEFNTSSKLYSLEYANSLTLEQLKTILGVS